MDEIKILPKFDLNWNDWKFKESYTFLLVWHIKKGVAEKVTKDK